MKHETIGTKLLNLLPNKSCKCRACGKEYTVKRGAIRISKQHYDGPFCPDCGTNA